MENNTTLKLTWLAEGKTASGNPRQRYSVSGSPAALASLETFVADYDDPKFKCPFSNDGSGWVYFSSQPKADFGTLVLRTSSVGTDYYVFQPASVVDVQAARLTEMMAKHPNIPAELLLKIIQGA